MMQARLFSLPFRDANQPVINGGRRLPPARHLQRDRVASGVLSLNPYASCPFGCHYCPAPGGETVPSDERGSEDRLPARHYPARTLLRALQPGRLRGRRIEIGTRADPYPPAENACRATRQILEVFARTSGYSLTINTQSCSITRDLDLLEQIASRHRLWIRFRLTSTDAQLVRALEPRASSPWTRLKTIRRLVRHGLSVSLELTPTLPGITDSNESLERVIAAACRAGVADLTWGMLRLPEPVRERFFGFLRQQFPHLVAAYERLYGDSPHVSGSYGAVLGVRIEGLKAKYGLPRKPAPVAGS